MAFHPCGMVMDFLRRGYHAKMRTIRGQEPTPVVWFRVPKENTVYRDVSPYRSRHWFDPHFNDGIGEQDLTRTGECRCPQWYNSAAPAQYVGDRYCGTKKAARYGADPGDPFFVTLDDGRALCCGSATERPESVAMEFGVSVIEVGQNGYRPVSPSMGLTFASMPLTEALLARPALGMRWEASAAFETIPARPALAMRWEVTQVQENVSARTALGMRWEVKDEADYVTACGCAVVPRRLCVIVLATDNSCAGIVPVDYDPNARGNGLPGWLGFALSTCTSKQISALVYCGPGNAWVVETKGSIVVNGLIAGTCSPFRLFAPVLIGVLEGSAKEMSVEVTERPEGGCSSPFPECCPVSEESGGLAGFKIPWVGQCGIPPGEIILEPMNPAGCDWRATLSAVDRVVTLFIDGEYAIVGIGYSGGSIGAYLCDSFSCSEGGVFTLDATSGFCTLPVFLTIIPIENE